MIGVDTNLLVRWVLDDDPAQADRAEAILTSGQDIFVNDVVLAEVAWVLSRRYRVARRGIAEVFQKLVDHPYIVFSNRDTVIAALNAYETGGAGLADHLIGAGNIAAGCRTTLTFDKGAGKGPSFTDV